MERERNVSEGKGSQTFNPSFSEMDAGIQFNMPKDQSVGIIKVVGVGGGGCNAVRNMYLEGITNVTYAACNTDS